VFVWHDQQNVIITSVTDQEYALDARHVLELLFNTARRNCLTTVILVDVLEPVDDFIVTGFVNPEQIPGFHPGFIGTRVERNGTGIFTLELGEIPSQVGSTYFKFTLVAKPHGHPRQRDANGIVLVIIWWCHRDATGCLGHAKSTAQGYLVALKEPEGFWSQVTCGR